MHRKVIICLHLVLAGAPLLAGGYAYAGTVLVDRPQCGPEVTLVAEEAMLSEVFTELAGKLGFALRFDRDSDRAVSLETTQAPEKLIESLTRNDNVMITTQDDPNCPGVSRITDVRFLAAGNPIVLPAHVPQDAAPMPNRSVNVSKNKPPKIDYESKKKRRSEMTNIERQQDRERQRLERRR